jgi:hypothetical protein
MLILDVLDGVVFPERATQAGGIYIDFFLFPPPSLLDLVIEIVN